MKKINFPNSLHTAIFISNSAASILQKMTINIYCLIYIRQSCSSAKSVHSRIPLHLDSRGKHLSEHAIWILRSHTVAIKRHILTNHVTVRYYCIRYRHYSKTWYHCIRYRHYSKTWYHCIRYRHYSTIWYHCIRYRHYSTTWYHCIRYRHYNTTWYHSIRYRYKMQLWLNPGWCGPITLEQSEIFKMAALDQNFTENC